MTDSEKPVVFIDSNVLIEALLESEPALAVLALATAEVISLVACQLVVDDVIEEILSMMTLTPGNIDAVIETGMPF